MNGLLHPAAQRGVDWELYAYRDRTAALLRRYLRLSLELGRLPSILGGQVFRARVTSYRLTSFEDMVIFVHDVESCLNRLQQSSREVLGNRLFQEYTEQELAEAMHCTVRTVRRWYGEALDEISELLLRVRLIEPFNETGERLAREGFPAAQDLPPKKPSVSSQCAACPRLLRGDADVCVSRDEIRARPYKVLKQREI